MSTEDDGSILFAVDRDATDGDLMQRALIVTPIYKNARDYIERGGWSQGRWARHKNLRMDVSTADKCRPHQIDFSLTGAIAAACWQYHSTQPDAPWDDDRKGELLVAACNGMLSAMYLSETSPDEIRLMPMQHRVGMVAGIMGQRDQSINVVSSWNDLHVNSKEEALRIMDTCIRMHEKAQTKLRERAS